MTLTTVLSIGGIVIFVAYEVVLRRREAATATWRGDSDDRGSTRLILAAYTATVVINIVFTGASVGEVGAGWRWVGIVVMVAGLALRAWAMGTLGRYYTRTLRTVEHQPVVDLGPYRLVRHPGYSGSLLIWVGYALGLGNWIAAALTFALLGAVYLWRVNAEETLLCASLGTQYADYQRHTKRLVPYLY
jgi:protein-S-isoprenylcysteine O-methyltransferase